MSYITISWSCDQKVSAELKGPWAHPVGLFLQPYAHKKLAANCSTDNKHAGASSVTNSPTYSHVCGTA